MMRFGRASGSGVNVDDYHWEPLPLWRFPYDAVTYLWQRWRLDRRITRTLKNHAQR